jgi:hypothetical protein
LFRSFKFNYNLVQALGSANLSLVVFNFHPYTPVISVRGYGLDLNINTVRQLRSLDTGPRRLGVGKELSRMSVMLQEWLRWRTFSYTSFIEAKLFMSSKNTLTCNVQ